MASVQHWAGITLWRALLAYIHKIGHLGNLFNLISLIVLALFAQLCLKFVAPVKMILNRTLCTTGYNNNLGHTSCHSFFNN